jgi:hypothetical protein
VTAASAVVLRYDRLMSRTPLIVLFAVATLVSVACSAAAQHPIVRLDCGPNGEAFPLCGASRAIGRDSVGVKWQRSYVAAERAVEIAILPGSTGEGYYGWTFEGLSAPPAGATRVLRFRLKPIGPIQWGDWGAKFIILGDDSGDDADRVISTMEMYEGKPHINIDKNIDGNYAFASLAPDEYTAIQMVIAPADGDRYNFKVYRNGTLVSTSRAFRINPTGWREVGVGLYGQFANGGAGVRYRFKDFELDDVYDPKYHLAR